MVVYLTRVQLFQVKDRIATLITTPPPSGGFFESVIRLIKDANARGDHYFHLQNDSLVCEECLANRIPDRCCHMFQCLPSWKSLIQLRHSMVRLVSKREQESFKMEVRISHQVLPSGTYSPSVGSWYYGKRQIDVLSLGCAGSNLLG